MRLNFIRRAFEQRRELKDVCADNETILGAADQDTAYGALVREFLHRLLQFSHRQRIELVDRLAPAVETQFDEACTQQLHPQGLALKHRFYSFGLPGLHDR